MKLIVRTDFPWAFGKKWSMARKSLMWELRTLESTSSVLVRTQRVDCCLSQNDQSLFVYVWMLRWRLPRWQSLSRNRFVPWGHQLGGHGQHRHGCLAPQRDRTACQWNMEQHRHSMASQRVPGNIYRWTWGAVTSDRHEQETSHLTVHCLLALCKRQESWTHNQSLDQAQLQCHVQW